MFYSVYTCDCFDWIIWLRNAIALFLWSGGIAWGVTGLRATVGIFWWLLHRKLLHYFMFFWVKYICIESTRGAGCQCIDIYEFNLICEWYDERLEYLASRGLILWENLSTDVLNCTSWGFYYNTLLALFCFVFYL